jgi:ABC-type dipeptide/oligopeptide/nickel transport system ATPase component
MRERELRSLRGRSLSLVLQSPLASLNPALQIRTQLGKPGAPTASAHRWRLRSSDPVRL